MGHDAHRVRNTAESCAPSPSDANRLLVTTARQTTDDATSRSKSPQSYNHISHLSTNHSGGYLARGIGKRITSHHSDSDEVISCVGLIRLCYSCELISTVEAIGISDASDMEVVSMRMM